MEEITNERKMIYNLMLKLDETHKEIKDEVNKYKSIASKMDKAATLANREQLQL